MLDTGDPPKAARCDFILNSLSSEEADVDLKEVFFRSKG